MSNIELAEKTIEAEIVMAEGTVVSSHATAPEGYNAGFDAGYVAGLRKALQVLYDVSED